MSEPNNLSPDEICGCPNGSYWIKHTAGCYERRIESQSRRIAELERQNTELGSWKLRTHDYDAILAIAQAPPPPLAVKALEWTPHCAPSDKVSYDHVSAETPFGRILITWKSWKESPNPTIDESPWGFGSGGWSVEETKKLAEQEYQRRLNAAPAASPPAAPTTPDIMGVRERVAR